MTPYLKCLVVHLTLFMLLSVAAMALLYGGGGKLASTVLGLAMGCALVTIGNIIREGRPKHDSNEPRSF